MRLVFALYSPYIGRMMKLLLEVVNMFKRIVIFAFAFATLAAAQTVNTVEENDRPDKQLSYTVTLDAPVKGTVTTIYLSFRLISDERPNQQGLETNFDLSTFKKNSDVQYEVTGERPHTMTGTYRLNAIQLRTGGGIRNYAYPQDFKQEVTVQIDTPEKDIFPNIKSVEPSH